MKISNSKKELARIINENGGWREGAAFSAQDGDGSVGGYGVKPEWDSRSRHWWRDALGDWFHVGKIKNHHQTILSREEYFHLYPAPDADGWIEWLRDELPVKEGKIIDVKYGDGDELYGAPCGLDVDMTSRDGHLACAHVFGAESDIIAYRLHKPDQAKPDYCESVTRSIPEPNDKPTIEQLAADYRNAKDYAERKQQEADDAKADADAMLKALELAGESIGLLVSPITAKQEPELVIADWRDLRVVDYVEVLSVTTDEITDKYNGMAGKVCLIDEAGEFIVDLECGPRVCSSKVKFIRRQ